MAIALVASVGAASTTSNNVTTAGANTTGANLIVLTVAAFNGNAGTLSGPSDSNTNTWTALTIRNSVTDGSWVRQYYCVSPSVGSGHTFSINSTAAYPSIYMQAFSGLDASPYDQENGAVGAGSITTLQNGSITPGGADYLFCAGMMTSAQLGTITIDSSFTITDQFLLALGQAEGGAMAYKIASGSGAEDPTWTFLGGGFGGVAASNMATFKIAAAGANTKRSFGLICG